MRNKGTQLALPPELAAGGLTLGLALWVVACSDTAGSVEETGIEQQGIGGTFPSCGTGTGGTQSSAGNGTGGGADWVTVAGAEDTQIVENELTLYGSRDRISVRGDGGSNPAMVGLIKWTLLPPPGCHVSHAYITLDVLSASSQSFYLYPVNREWSALSASWWQATFQSTWQAPGAAGFEDRGFPFHQFVPSSSGLMRIDFDCVGVALVQSWVDHPGSNGNQGIVIAHPTHTNGFSIASAEDASAAHRPTLTYRCTF